MYLCYTCFLSFFILYLLPHVIFGNLNLKLCTLPHITYYSILYQIDYGLHIRKYTCKLAEYDAEIGK